MKHFVYFLIALVFHQSCNLEDNAADLDSPCVFELETLKSSNDISEEYKKEIESLLPEPENNFSQGIFRTGINASDSTVKLLFTSSESNNTPTSADLTIMQYIDGSSTAINVDDFDLNLAGTLALSISSVLDYSGSMTSENIEEAIDIYKDFFAVVHSTNTVEANHLVFSKAPVQVLPLSESISSDLTFQEQIERGAVNTRPSAIKLLIVTTDGLENASVDYTEDQLTRFANDNNVTIIIVGSLFSDLALFRRLTKATNGFFVYQRTIGNLRAEMNEIARYISNQTYQVTLPNNEADSIFVTYQNTTIQYAP